ncbi:hypothetical protein BJV74DRAFT_886627 [Russula compacta]|nr:hypothetical protein BJV74DRAFT_886627 [Russula compacta]
MSSDIATAPFKFDKTVNYAGHTWILKGTLDTAAYFLDAHLDVNLGIGLIASPHLSGSLRGVGLAVIYYICPKNHGSPTYYIKDGGSTRN